MTDLITIFMLCGWGIFVGFFLGRASKSTSKRLVFIDNNAINKDSLPEDFTVVAVDCSGGKSVAHYVCWL